MCVICTCRHIYYPSPLCTVLVPVEGIRPPQPEPAVGRQAGLEDMPGRVLLVVAVVQVLVVAGLSAAVVSVDPPGGNRRPGEPRLPRVPRVDQPEVLCPSLPGARALIELEPHPLVLFIRLVVKWVIG